MSNPENYMTVSIRQYAKLLKIYAKYQNRYVIQVTP